jgi:hypothetical protein
MLNKSTWEAPYMSHKGKTRSQYLKNRVRQLLANPDVGKKYQKSDLALVARIWFDDINKIKYGAINQVSAIQVLDMLRNGDLTQSESITRCRRQLQSEYPELRDESVYKGRKDKEQEMRRKSQFY